MKTLFLGLTLIFSLGLSQDSSKVNLSPCEHPLIKIAQTQGLKSVPIKDIYRYNKLVKACEKNSIVRPCTPKPRKLADENDQILSSKPLTLQELGYAPFEIHPNSAFPFQGGSGAASERLNHYFWISINYFLAM